MTEIVRVSDPWRLERRREYAVAHVRSEVRDRDMTVARPPRHLDLLL